MTASTSAWTSAPPPTGCNKKGTNTVTNLYYFKMCLKLMIQDGLFIGRTIAILATIKKLAKKGQSPVQSSL